LAAILLGIDLRREEEEVMRSVRRGAYWVLVVIAGAAASGCGARAKLSVIDGTGANPVLPPPNGSLIPVVKVVTAKGWPPEGAPEAPPGAAVVAFARGLNHPRWLHVLPNGDVLVAETNAPVRPDNGPKGLKGWFFTKFQKKAGGAVPSANRITLLRDADGDGIAETRHVFLENLSAPFGMALVGNQLYIANSDALVRVPYAEGSTSIQVPPSKVVDLPGGTINHHWTKSLIAAADGSKLYVGSGSNSNVAERGMENEVERACILEIDPKTGTRRVYASGLRNPVGLEWEPSTRALWVAVNERDELGSDLVPDYITSVREGAFYGWPYSYYGANVDKRVKPPRPDLVAAATKPDYALGPHTASLGLAYSNGSDRAPIAGTGMFVGQHGSWNRQPRSGYKVIFVPFAGGRPSGMPQDVLTGFVNENGDAMGRPVGVAVARDGALLVADDVGNAVWRVARQR
jgi:glucose/arabinose dehydrogenase